MQLLIVLASQIREIQDYCAPAAPQFTVTDTALEKILRTVFQISKSHTSAKLSFPFPENNIKMPSHQTEGNLIETKIIAGKHLSIPCASSIFHMHTFSFLLMRLPSETFFTKVSFSAKLQL